MNISTRLGFAVMLAAGLAAANAHAVGPGNLGTIAVPSTITYGDSFATIPAVINNVGGIDYNFYDDYTFTLTDATANSITSTVDLAGLFAINNLQARLFAGSGPFVNTTVNPIAESWGSSFSAGVSTVTNVVLNPVALAAGTYTLELRGTVAGVNGGSYAGVLNVAAVPEPGTWIMMMAGMLVVGAIAGRGRTTV